MYTEMSRDFAKNIGKRKYSIEFIVRLIKENSFEIYANQWIENMYETILSEYEILDEFNTKDLYS